MEANTLNKRTLSVIMTLALSVVISGNVFATPSTSSSDALTQTQNEKKTLQLKVQTLNNQIDKVINSIQNNKNNMNKVNQDIKSTEIKLETTKLKSKAENDLFKKRVRAMYISGVDGYMDILLSSNNLDDFISRISMITKIMGFDRQIIDKLNEEKQAISNQKEVLSNEHDKLEALKTSNETTLSKLNQTIEEQKYLLSKATTKEQNLMAAQKAAAFKQFAFSGSKDFTLSRGMVTSPSYSQVLNIEATAYSGDGITASGTPTRRDIGGYSTIAVDPRVIPLGSRVYVEGYGYAIADDIGGAIKGNIIDLFFPSESEAQNWGRRSVRVYILK